MPETHRSALSLPTGYSKPKDNKWKKLYEKIPHHQSSSGHKMCYVEWRRLEENLRDNTTINFLLNDNIKTEVERWRQILRRVLDVILFLGERGLAFRGDSHLIGDLKNGNFLGIIFGHYDSILHDHLEKNEFIQCCADKVTDVILDEREKCKYFSMIVDATPDTAHIEQNAFILRYVLQDKLTGKYEVKERFLEFVDCNKKTGEDIANIIISTLQKHKISLMCCRGQGYDNGSNMKGSVKGAQARILQHYSLATYSPCACHNLCGAQAAECCPQVITFFGIVQKLYNIFSSSPQRWEIFYKNIGSSLHSMSKTRWSARVDCIKLFATYLPGIIKSVADIRNLNLSIENRADLNGIISYMESFECILMSTIWFKVLTAINYTNLVLQAQNATLDVEVTNIKRLIDELKTLRDK
ncbi:zinc finger MYM-type protein 1-like [Hydra vulgaris]|uniref:zinc finger MYM-type protein 1-like n=1 Tax=Hydra vulgaris TaxID=6087 RepID=UPI001F5E5DAC|nr:zinc finger MYM-type protein 1-like [Hydra vulgaris]